MSDIPVINKADDSNDSDTPGVKDIIANVLQLLFASGKLNGIIRGLVCAVCGSSATVTHDTIKLTVNIIGIAVMVAWGW